MRTVTGGAFETEMLPPQYGQQQSDQATTVGWKSPVPYLFGGLAAMLGLIAFALLILACSYWKLSNFIDQQDSTARQGEAKGGDDSDKDEKKVELCKSVLVIMAGDEKPTFIAMPVENNRIDRDGVKDRDKVMILDGNHGGVGSETHDDDDER